MAGLQYSKQHFGATCLQDMFEIQRYLHGERAQHKAGVTLFREERGTQVVFFPR